MPKGVIKKQENIFENHKCDKEFMHRLYREILLLSDKG